jgi:hypothetical protein
MTEFNVWEAHDGYKLRAAIARRASAGARARMMVLEIPLAPRPVVEPPPKAEPPPPKRRKERPVFVFPVFAPVNAFGQWPAYLPPVLYDHCEGAAPKKSIRQIALEVVEKHGITLEELLSPRRATHIVRARQEAFWRCKQETSSSFPQIGRHLGNKDHTTVLHGIRMYEKRKMEAELLLSVDKSGNAQQG